MHRTRSQAARILLGAGAVAGLTGVAAGAFGAHALADRLAEGAGATWDTAVLYHLVHAPALLALAGLPHAHASLVHLAGLAFAIGIVLFSGSLYALALTGLGDFGLVTPLGGLAFLAGWILLLVAALMPRPGQQGKQT